MYVSVRDPVHGWQYGGLTGGGVQSGARVWGGRRPGGLGPVETLLWFGLQLLSERLGAGTWLVLPSVLDAA